MKSYLFQGSCRFQGTSTGPQWAVFGPVKGKRGHKEFVMFWGPRLCTPRPGPPRALFHCGQEEPRGHHTHKLKRAGAAACEKHLDALCSAFAPSHMAQTHSQPSAGTYAYRNPVLLCLWVRPGKRRKGIIACCHPFILQQSQF